MGHETTLSSAASLPSSADTAAANSSDAEHDAAEVADTSETVATERSRVGVSGTERNERRPHWRRGEQQLSNGSLSQQHSDGRGRDGAAHHSVSGGSGGGDKDGDKEEEHVRRASGFDMAMELAGILDADRDDGEHSGDDDGGVDDEDKTPVQNAGAMTGIAPTPDPRDAAAARNTAAGEAQSPHLPVEPRADIDVVDSVAKPEAHRQQHEPRADHHEPQELSVPGLVQQCYLSGVSEAAFLVRVWRRLRQDAAAAAGAAADDEPHGATTDSEVAHARDANPEQEQPSAVLAAVLVRLISTTASTRGVLYLRETIMHALVRPYDALRALCAHFFVSDDAAATSERIEPRPREEAHASTSTSSASSLRLLVVVAPLLTDLVVSYTFHVGTESECSTYLAAVTLLVRAASGHGCHSAAVVRALRNERVVALARAAGRRAPRAWDRFEAAVDSVDDEAGSAPQSSELLRACLLFKRPVGCALCTLESLSTANKMRLNRDRTILRLLAHAGALGTPAIEAILAFWVSDESTPAEDARRLLLIGEAAAHSAAEAIGGGSDRGGATSGGRTHVDPAQYAEYQHAELHDMCGALVRIVHLETTKRRCKSGRQRQQAQAANMDAQTLPLSALFSSNGGVDGVDTSLLRSDVDLARYQCWCPETVHEWGGVERLMRLIHEALPIVARRLSGGDSGSGSSKPGAAHYRSRVDAESGVVGIRERACLAIALAVVSTAVLVLGPQMPAMDDNFVQDGVAARIRSRDALLARAPADLFRFASRLVRDAASEARYDNGRSVWQLGVFIVFLEARTPFMLGFARPGELLEAASALQALAAYAPAGACRGERGSSRMTGGAGARTESNEGAGGGGGDGGAARMASLPRSAQSAQILDRPTLERLCPAVLDGADVFLARNSGEEGERLIVPLSQGIA